MKRLVYMQDKYVAKWISDRIPGNDTYPAGTPAIGLIEDGELIAGVCYTNYTGNGITMHVASSKKGWLCRDFLRAAFAYPFKFLRCDRVSGLVRTDNKDAQRFDEHLGFVREGVIRRGDDDGCDLILYGMLKEECRFLEI